MNDFALPAAPATLRMPVPVARNDRVDVRGWIRNPLALTPAALERLDPPALADFVVVCSFDGAHGDSRRVRGVPLRAPVLAAEPAFETRTDFKRVALVAHSTDGYRALFSWSEVFNSVVGDGVVIGWDCPEAPIPAKAGPFVLVSLYDRATGPRFVQRLAAIEVVRMW